ncbi:hypothetical protein [Nocardia sp. NPDC059239]
MGSGSDELHRECLGLAGQAEGEQVDTDEVVGVARETGQAKARR